MTRQEIEAQSQIKDELREIDNMEAEENDLRIDDWKEEREFED